VRKIESTRSKMAAVSSTFAFVAAALFIFAKMQGGDSYIILLQFGCPYVDPNTKCQLILTPTCNVNTTCANGGICCPIGCDGAVCVAPKALCPLVTNSTTKCTDKDKELSCSQSSDCGQKSSCCSNDCGGSSCLSQKKRGECPALPTGVFACPMMSAGFIACNSDSNCAGDLKCCPQTCHGNQCTAPAKH